MPTGYTSDVADGKITTLRPFALQCARAFGALIMMRDEPHDAPIPKKFEPDTYYLDMMDEAKKEIDFAKNASDEEIEELLKKEKFEAIARNEARVEKEQQTRKNYENMIKLVSEWKDPPEGLKSFMLEQLNSSIRFDCNYPTYQESLDGFENVAAWRKESLKKSNDDFEYARESYSEEVSRTNERNEWLKQLFDSLPAE